MADLLQDAFSLISPSGQSNLVGPIPPKMVQPVSNVRGVLKCFFQRYSAKKIKKEAFLISNLMKVVYKKIYAIIVFYRKTL